jgi:hypothetical protein
MAFSQNVISQNSLPPMQWKYSNSSQYHPIAVGEDWFYNVTSTSDGGYLGAGYAEIAVNQYHPSVSKVDANGNKLWEQYFQNGNKCLNSFEVSDGYIIFGDDGSTNLFYIKLDKSTGAIIVPMKNINIQSFGYPALTQLNIRPDGPNPYNFFEEFKEVRDNSGNITGFLCASTLIDYSQPYPNWVYAGGIIMKFDLAGNVDNTFGNNPLHPGMLLVSDNSSPHTYYQTALRSVCVDYDALGNPQAIVFSGTRKNNTTGHDNDIYIGKANITGSTILWEQTYTESTLISNYGYINTTNPYPYLCSSGTIPADKPVAEYGSYIRQISNGGGYIMTAHNRWSLIFGCGSPSYTLLNAQSYIDLDLALISVNTNGVVNWAKKIDHSTGIDFFTPLKVLPSGAGFVVGTNNATDPLAVRARIIKTDINGHTLWSSQYLDNSLGQTENCLFGMDLTLDGGIVYGGNNDVNDEDYEMVKIYNECNAPADITGSGNIINITSNTTWNSSHIVSGSVHVKAPAVLTITGINTIIEFNDTRTTGVTTNIYVENGASLNINSGAKLTSLVGCSGSMWDGVILQGQTTQLSQTNANQPQAYLTAVTIENARTGFLVGDNTTNPYNGGILKVADSYFYNNNIDVQFNPYTAPLVGGSEPNNISYLTNSVFAGTSYLNDATTYGLATTDKHVWFNQVKGIFVKGCGFSTDPSLMGSSYGIYSTDATFTVMRRCNIIGPLGQCGGNPSSFTNLQYGIYAQSTNNTKNFTVDQNLFTNCSGSIYESGINYSTITSNTFAITAAVPPITNHACSISHSCVAWFHYINNCSGFTHQENVHNVSGTTQHVMGTIFNGTSASTAGLTYRNTYSGLYQSHQVQGGNTNLQVQCNQSVGTTFADISVTSGVFPTQGLPTNAQSLANNTFSRPNFSSTSDINSSTTSFIYYYNSIPSTGGQVPTFKTANVTGSPNGTFGSFLFSSACPTKLGSGGGGGAGRMANNNSKSPLTPLINSNNLKQLSKDEISYNTRQAQYALDQAITNLLNDTIKPNRDSLLIVLLKTDTTEKGKTDLVHVYLGRKDYVNAQLYINQIKVMQDCSKKGAFLQHCKDLKQQNKTWQDLNTNASLRNDLVGFAYDSLSNGFGNARSVLAMVKKTHNYEYVEIAKGGAAANNNRLANTDNTENLHVILDANQIQLNAYPNPFNNELTVSVTLPENIQGAKLQLIEPATGRILMEKTLEDKQQEVVLDTKELSSGLYLIGIKSTNSKAQFIKVTTFK